MSHHPHREDYGRGYYDYRHPEPRPYPERKPSDRVHFNQPPPPPPNFHSPSRFEMPEPRDSEPPYPVPVFDRSKLDSQMRRVMIRTAPMPDIRQEQSHSECIEGIRAAIQNQGNIIDAAQKLLGVISRTPEFITGTNEVQCATTVCLDSKSTSPAWNSSQSKLISRIQTVEFFESVFHESNPDIYFGLTNLIQNEK